MKQPETIKQLITVWDKLIHQKNDENDEDIAFDIVSSLAGNDYLWDEWYASDKEPNVCKIFDNAADLELPNGHLVTDAADRKARWTQIESCMAELNEKFNQ